MRILKNLKSIFIEETDSTGATEETPSREDQPSFHSPESGEKESKVADSASEEERVQIPEVKAKNTHSPDEKFLGVLLSALEENNFEGYDYFDYRETLKSLQEVAMDEKTRFLSAYAMAKTMKADYTQLARTGRAYIQILEKEKIKFAEALKSREATDLKSRENQIVELDSEIARMQKEVEALLAQIQTAKSRQDTLRSELQLTHQKMLDTQTRFDHTHTYLIDQIQSDLIKMEKHLK